MSTSKTLQDASKQSFIDLGGADTAQRVISGELSMRVDYTSTNNVIYLGFAKVGSLDTDASWQITKYDLTGVITQTWADSDFLFDNIWSNRTSLTYG